MKLHDALARLLCRRTEIALICALFLIVLLLSLIFHNSMNRGFHRDEFEALKTAWKIVDGGQIYTDFFQHHHPFLYYLLTTLFIIEPENVNVVFKARILIFGLFICILISCYKITKLLFTGRAAIVCVLFICCMSVITNVAIEIRPDVPSLLFFLLSYYFLLKHEATKSRWLTVYVGVLAGVSFLFLQKIAIAYFLLFLVYLIRCMQRQFAWADSAKVLIGFVCVWLIYVFPLFFNGGFGDYIYFNFIFNLYGASSSQGGVVSYQIGQLAKLIIDINYIVLLVFALGVCCSRTRAQMELVFVFSGLLVFALFYKIQFHQYYLVPLVIACLIAGDGWVQLESKNKLLAFILLFVVVAPAIMFNATNPLSNSNAEQIKKLRYALNSTSPSDYVYDGAVKFNLFRKDLDFFWYNVRKGQSLSIYKSLNGYEYDIYELIKKYKPTLISTWGIDDLNNDYISANYSAVPEFDDLLMRIE